MGRALGKELGTRLSSSDSLARLAIACEMWGEKENRLSNGALRRLGFLESSSQGLQKRLR